MEVADYVTPEDIDEAPDDPPAAFVQLVRLADARRKKSGTADNKRNFHLAVLGLAKAYDIAPFSGESPPPRIYSDTDWIRFKSELDIAITEMMISASRLQKRDAVAVGSAAKERIRNYVNGLKSAIDQSGLPESRKDALHAKLRELEALLDGNKVNLWAVARIVFEVLSVSANGVALYESATINKLTSGIVATLAEAKGAEDDTRRLPPSLGLALLPSPPSVPTPSNCPPKESG